MVLEDRMPCDLEEDQEFLGKQWDTRAVRMPIPISGSAMSSGGASSSGIVRGSAWTKIGKQQRKLQAYACWGNAWHVLCLMCLIFLCTRVHATLCWHCSAVLSLLPLSSLLFYPNNLISTSFDLHVCLFLGLDQCFEWNVNDVGYALVFLFKKTASLDQHNIKPMT